MNLLCAVCKNYEATTAQCTVGERGEEGERERERFPQYLNLNQSQIAPTFSAAFFSGLVYSESPLLFPLSTLPPPLTVCVYVCVVCCFHLFICLANANVCWEIVRGEKP